jgi:hypothetical protein
VPKNALVSSRRFPEFIASIITDYRQPLPLLPKGFFCGGDKSLAAYSYTFRPFSVSNTITSSKRVLKPLLIPTLN